MFEFSVIRRKFLVPLPEDFVVESIAPFTRRTINPITRSTQELTSPKVKEVVVHHAHSDPDTSVSAVHSGYYSRNAQPA